MAKLTQSAVGMDFPCIICRSPLERAALDEGQPSEGVACSTHGNYGSTKYDPMDGRYLAFNICDKCIVHLGAEGLIWETRTSRPIIALCGKYRSVIGWQRVDRPYVEWNLDLPGDDDKIEIDLYDTDWDSRDDCKWNVDLALLREQYPKEEQDD